ncbi:hypothetical protein CVD28_17525 [Bacillus sp. M6-12]|uniref:hypothetical protein n=1 Tax=Bacillus sp. M6-12 TaxID=2054166 RepID=UPI000C776087|nr:hypothetical protein [Bacillus sp. M6-12]PLS16277.1 hypothetical protein CVD28_17525 [Bacillus sp. M6-12]
MFDPTAFENMKIVLEGAVYDLDFAGDVTVTNRVENINLSSLSREYEVEMELKKPQTKKRITAAIRLEAGLENLSAELLENAGDMAAELAGCHAEIKFNLDMAGQKTDGEKLLCILEEIWGKDRRIVFVSRKIQDNKGFMAECAEIKVFFGRLLTEEQISDLQPMASCCVHALQALENWANEER